MKYKAGMRRKASEYEKALVEWWKKNQIFEKSVEQRPIDESYVFYDGPPFITGMPHHGTLLSSIVKDAVPRYWTMRGKRVERRWGWDCHGLPAENFVEKQLGITDRREIGTKWSLEDYISKARESMVANSETWEGTIDRIGRWVDFRGAYRTMDKDFMESVWWAFKTLYEAGKIYEGRKVLMYDTKFATPVSKSEVTMDNDAYQTVTDPSAFVKFRLADTSALLETADATSGHLESVSSRKSNKVLSELCSEASAQKKEQALSSFALLSQCADGAALTFAKQTSDEPGASDVSQKTDVSASQVSTKAGVCLDDAKSNVYFLAWTTTPWTLPANMALAVNPEMEYCAVKVWASDGVEAKTSQPEIMILAKSRLEAVLKDVDYEVVREGIKGSELVGLTYEPICDTIDREAKLKNTWTVLGGDFVSDADGTGVVHIAPAYGEDDYKLAQANEVGFVDVLDEYGYYLPEAAEWLHGIGVRDTDEQGIEIWAGNKFIAKCLEEKGIVWKIEYIKHEYPFNPRSKQRIMYRAFPSWFFDVQGQKELMLAQNENINWFPEYLKHGRFAKNIEQAPDWNLSRDRFWATAMPVWKGDRGSVKVVGSYDELYELSGVRLEDYHRPWVDEIEFEIDGEHFKRIDKVLDCWFESGSMPFAQLHYPFENKEKFERNYPADFIVEYVGQVRAWFYYIHCVNTALASIGAFGNISTPLETADATSGHLESVSSRKSSSDGAALTFAKQTSDEPGASDVSRSAELFPDSPAQANNFVTGVASGKLNAFKNVITTGTLAGNDGRKMSKSLGNYTDPNELMDRFSADALRFLLLSSPVLSGEDFALTDKDVSDTQRKLAMIWNVYDFFVMYASVDGYDSPELPGNFGKELENPLDIWIIARLHQLKAEVMEGMEEYNIPKALSGVLLFVDDLSNWFVRRSRRRFWKSEDDSDKAEAYWTLWKVLTNLARILAPFTPFLAEELWQNMTGEWAPEMSVHLQDFPTCTELDEEMEKVLVQMARVREVINEGLRLRMYADEKEKQVKVRQPLQKLIYAGEKLPEWGEEMIRDEVNVKVVEQGTEAWLDKEITPELAQEGFVRELVRAVQSARKKAGLQVDDRIKLSVSCEVPEEWWEMLKNEVLAEEVTREGNYEHDEIAKVNGENVTISLEKVTR